MQCSSMSYLRFKIDLAIKQPIPAELQPRLPAIRDYIRQLKAYAMRINAGLPNEEPMRATFHICRHDEGKPCEPEQEI